MQNVGSKLSLALTVPLVAFGASAFKASSDAAELQSAFNVTFGAMSKDMNDWARTTGDAMGRSTQTIQTAANTFGMFFNQAAKTRGEAAELSKTFAVLAQDLGSFFNVDPSIAMEKLRAGLSGEAEPLRAFGVFLNEGAVAAEAMRMGLAKTNKELTDQDKILARANLILAATKNAQGDVARTSGGTANQIVRAKEAFRELQVTIGTKLLPVITPLIVRLGNMLDAFSRLPDGVQTGIVALAGISAAFGPLLIGLGAITSAIAPFASAVGYLFAQGGVLFAAKGAIMGLTVAFGPWLIAIAAVAAAGYLIYENWDKIAPVLKDLWSTITTTLGPPLTNLINALKAAFTELWSGPLGSAIKAVAPYLLEFGKVLAQVFGAVIIGSIRLLASTFGVAFDAIAIAVRVITALFDGTFRTVIVNALKAVYEGVKTWLLDKLNAVWEQVKAKIDAVKGFFRGLYDAVVGRSYIPDMVDGIAQQMARLDAVMVNPAKTAAERTKQHFEKLASDVDGIMRRLYPDAAATAGFAGDRAALNAGIAAGGASGYTPPQLQDALKSLQSEEFKEAFKDFQVVANDNAAAIETANVRIVESFKDMADKTIGALQGLANSIKGGGFLDILGSVIGLGLQLGSVGLFGKSIQTSINKAPGFAAGTGSAPRGLALVGERGPELVKFNGGERVYSNSESRGMGRGGGDTRISVEASPFFDVRINGHIMQAAGPIANAGSDLAMRKSAYNQSRRLA